jgi:tetratricopeptide (TPR) repeat protein
LAFILLLVLIATSAGAVNKEDMERAEGLKKDALGLFNKGEYRNAIPLLKEVLAINPEDKDASRYLLIFRRQIIEPYCKLAADAFIQGDYPEAVSQWQKILEMDPKNKRVQSLISETFTASDDDITSSMLTLSTSLFKEGRYDEASAELQKILQINAGNERAKEMLASIRRTLTDTTIKDLYEKASTYVEQKEYVMAVEQWNKILEIDPEQDLASRQLASIQKKQLDDSYNMAEQYYIDGNYLDARDHYNRILAENPTDQNLKNIIERLNQTISVVPQIQSEGAIWDVLRTGLSHHISKDGNSKVAVAAAWYAVQLEPENTVIIAIRDFIEREHVSVIRTMEKPGTDMNITDQYLFAALNHIYEGRYDLAIQECSLVIELEPANVLALKRMGSAYFAMGRKDKAKKAWNDALKLTPDDKELKQFIRHAK